MITHFLAFLGVAAIVIVTPGQDTALTIRNTLLGGRRSGILTAAGVSTGQAVWALATSAGLAAVLQASEPAFVAVKVAGATYLVYLGLQTLVPALRRGARKQKAPRAEGRFARESSATSAIRRWRCSSRACCRSSPAGPRSERCSYSGSSSAR